MDITKLEVQDTTAPNVTGGYMLKIDRADPDERTFYDPYLQGNIVFLDPKGLEMVDPAWQAQANYITSYFSQFGAAHWGRRLYQPADRLRRLD